MLFLLALADGLLGLGLRAWMSGQRDIWALIVIAAVFVAFAYVYWSMYLQADDTAIVVRFGVTRRYARRDVAAIRIGRFDPPIDVNWQFEGAQAALREASSRGSTKVR